MCLFMQDKSNCESIESFAFSQDRKSESMIEVKESSSGRYEKSNDSINNLESSYRQRDERENSKMSTVTAV